LFNTELQITKEDFMKPENSFAFAGKISIAFFLFFCLNCGKDNDNNSNVAPIITPPDTCPNCQLLYYGQNAADAPTLDAGSYEASARFTPTKIGNLVGKTIKEIRYFILDKPDSIKLKLYGPLDDSKPGELLYSADVTDSTKRGWNTHILTEALTLKNEDTWLSVAFKVGSSRKTVGCDPGPALPDGDWLYNAMDGQWTPFNIRSGISINWTIRLNIAL
jgi:hypothetical protein